MLNPNEALHARGLRQGLVRILVVAATERELAGAAGALTLCCGVGPVEAAAATAASLAAHRPAAVLHVGIAGARRGSGIVPVSIVIGSESIYVDLDSGDWAPRVITPSSELLAAARRALPGAALRSIGTSARVGGAKDCDVEAMEGFGVLRAAQRAGVPAVEVRAIANEIEEADRSRWRFDEAFAAVASATPRLLAELAACVS
jgi:nucleoside phosphorylase